MYYNDIKCMIINSLFENEKILKIENLIKEKGIPSEYKLKLGKILSPNKAMGRNIFPYNLWVENNKFNFRVAIYPNNLDDIIQDGIVIYGSGTYNPCINIVFDDYMKWQKNYKFEDLKNKAKDRVIKNDIGDKNFITAFGRTISENKHYLNKILKVNKNGKFQYNGHPLDTIENNMYIKPENDCPLLLVYRIVAETFFRENNYDIYCDVHHINCIPCDSKISNLLMVSLEQHASIEQFMWDKYYINKNSFLMRKK